VNENVRKYVRIKTIFQTLEGSTIRFLIKQIIFILFLKIQLSKHIHAIENK